MKQKDVLLLENNKLCAGRNSIVDYFPITTHLPNVLFLI